jgi:hypothetical protein
VDLAVVLVLQVAAPAQPQLTSADRHRFVQAVAAEVRQHYFDTQVAETTASALLAHERAGDYNAVDDGRSFATPPISRSRRPAIQQLVSERFRTGAGRR